jgi:hypothetical protein
LFFTQAGTSSALANEVTDPTSRIAAIAVIVVFINGFFRSLYLT